MVSRIIHRKIEKANVKRIAIDYNDSAKNINYFAYNFCSSLYIVNHFRHSEKEVKCIAKWYLYYISIYINESVFAYDLYM